MSKPVVAQTSPYGYDVEEGKNYLWCACGKSTTQPICDGASHKDTGIKPLRYTADETRKVWFCGCKQTSDQPMCDGSHNTLEG